MLAAIADGRVQAAMLSPARWNPKMRSLRCPPLRFSGDVDRRRQAACRHRAAPSCGRAAEERPAAALSDALAAFRHLVQDAAENTGRSLGLSIRTYDKTSTEVFASVGAKAISISFADTMPKLIDAASTRCCRPETAAPAARFGSISRFFSEITYSLPLSSRASIRRSMTA